MREEKKMGDKRRGKEREIAGNKNNNEKDDDLG
jgi:hypothetical protein